MTPSEALAIRTDAGLSQRELAALFGVHVDSIRNYEHGRKPIQGPVRTLYLVLDRGGVVLLRTV